MKKLLLALALLLAPLGAGAQNYTKNAAIIGAGPGFKSFLMVGPCSTGQVLTWTAGVAQCGSVAGSGTVTSVGLVLPTAVFTVTISPITSSGNLTAIFANQSANQVFAGPASGGPGVPGFRALVGADLPLPTPSTLGGVESLTPISHQWVTSLSPLSGQLITSQPAFSDLSGSLAPTQCPAAILNTLGCVQGINQITSQWVNSVVSGVPITSQPTFNDIAGQAALTQLPTMATQTLLANTTGGPATPTASTLTAILDAILGSTQGDIIYRGASVWTVLAPGVQGQVLATSGINQNPVWFTVSGTGTVTSIRAATGLNATASNPITTAGIIGLAPINGSGDVLSNITGGSAAPVDNTLTATIDAALGSVQGNILYRGPSTWTVLAPGTAGQYLQSGGAAANPVWATHTAITNSVSVDVAMNNTSNFFDGPSTAQGTSGTWLATGTASVLDTGGGSAFVCKLWDGTTVIASTAVISGGASFIVPMPLSGIITSPAANIRISCRDLSNTTGKILTVTTGSGNVANASTLTVVRLQ